MIQSLLIASPHMKPHLPYLRPCLSYFRLTLFLVLTLLCSIYFSSYCSWIGPFLSRASEGMRIRLSVPSRCMQSYTQSRIRDCQDMASTSTTSFEPSPVPYDNWHTLFDFFQCPVDNDEPPPWPSFPARLFPTLCMCFLVHMWFYN